MKVNYKNEDYDIVFISETLDYVLICKDASKKEKVFKITTEDSGLSKASLETIKKQLK